MPAGPLILEDGSGPGLRACNAQTWRCVSDQVMGGVSSATLAREQVAGAMALRLRGQVRLENNGGFVQMALDLAPGGAGFDASGFGGIGLRLRGNGASYNVHLRSRDLTRVWQSYRARVTATGAWQDVMLPFAAFHPHRTDAPLDRRRLTRIGLVAIGEVMEADLALARLWLYPEAGG